VPEDFVVARNPDPASSLPYLIRLPLGPAGVVLKARETWPRTSKVYCHRADEWPADAEVVERVPTRSCVRRGAAIDLVLDRGRENRSQIVFTYVRGREAIFWQTARTTKQARPGVRLPTARAQGRSELEVIVDSQERYAYRFAKQQVRVTRKPMPAGDYGVEADGRLIAAVERKSLADLAAGLTSGRLRFQLTELAALPRAAVVVEDRYSAVFALEHVRPSVVADALAEEQVRWPTVPVVNTETRSLAEERTYRWLAAALQEAQAEAEGHRRTAQLTEAGPLAAPEPTTAQVRAWAVAAGLPVADRGRLRPEVLDAYRRAHAIT
jgi:ERCC4-type nuclease